MQKDSGVSTTTSLLSIVELVTIGKDIVYCDTVQLGKRAWVVMLEFT